VILDSSAIVESELRLPKREWVIEQLDHAETVAVGAPTLLETAMVLLSRGIGSAEADLEALLAERSVVVIPFGAEHWRIAMLAFAAYGKGRHPARLNFGDCLTYAVAKLAGEPLLCVGGDFAQTDLALVR
jgi:ribonuclease VapC